MPSDMLRQLLLPFLAKFVAVLAVTAVMVGLFFYLMGKLIGFVFSRIGGLFARKSKAVFRARQALLTDPEQELFRRLAAALPEHVVLSQVAFSRLLYTAGPDPKDNFRTMASATQKVADFVVCGPRFGVVCLVELDDSSHDPKKDAARDAVTAQAGLKTVRWHVSSLPGAEEIRWKILGLNGAPRSGELAPE